MAIFVVVSFLVLVLGRDCLAWGAGTHVQLANELLDSLGMLPAGLAALLGKYGFDFVYGNVAADMVLGRKLSRRRRKAHGWRSGLKLLDQAGDDPARAFAYGYLAHLAADTVAHNEYIPHQCRHAGTGRNLILSHIYWEMRADGILPTDCWEQLRRTVACRVHGHERLMAKSVHPGPLLIGLNRGVFSRMCRFASRPHVRDALDWWQLYSRRPVSRKKLQAYRTESLQRMISVLSQPQNSWVYGLDPNGGAVLEEVRQHWGLASRTAGALPQPQEQPLADDKGAEQGTCNWDSIRQAG